MYELDDYLAMVSDRLRTPAYLEAMAQVIRPGDRVLDLGTGFGYFAVHACKLGAARVWAIEPNDAVGLGRAIAEANGVADRITFLQGWSTDITLPERADVMIEDLRGISPLHGERIAALRDARTRLLVPSARRVPLADEFIAAPAEIPDDLAMLDAASAIDTVVVEPVRRRLREAVHRTSGGPEVLLAPGRRWARLDLATLTDPDPSGEVEWIAARNGRLAGLLSWFRAVLTPDVAFETSPDIAKSVYGRGFLPLAHAIEVQAGDIVGARIRTRFDGSEYVWAWDVTVRREGSVITEQRCSNLASRLLSAQRRASRAGDHQPTRTDAVEVIATLLSSVDGSASLHEIAATLRTRHPDRFPTTQASLHWAGERLARITEEPAR